MTKQEKIDEALLKFVKRGLAVGVRAAIKAGANVHVSTDIALKWASFLGQAEVVKLLLEAGADVRSVKDVDLINYLCTYHPKVVKLLKQYGAKL